MTNKIMKYKLGILGLGKMGSSILSGIIKSKLYNKEDILLYDVNEEVQNNLLKEGFTFAINEKKLLQSVEKVLIAIKPQMLSKLPPLALDDYSLTVISIVAGKTINDLEEIFSKQKYIRVMPNTPSLIQFGATAICRNDQVASEEFLEVKQIFASIGVVEEVPEDKMNEVIPLNGSMPAFLYYFARSFIEEGVANGLSYEVSKSLVCWAIIGSSKMILESDKPIEELIKDVCSPGGATLEGMKVLEEANVDKILKEVSKKSIQRAYELSKIK